MPTPILKAGKIKKNMNKKRTTEQVFGNFQTAYMARNNKNCGVFVLLEYS